MGFMLLACSSARTPEGIQNSSELEVDGSCTEVEVIEEDIHITSYEGLEDVCKTACPVEIYGSLTISETFLYDVDPLICVTKVDGLLALSDNLYLTNLLGFSSLKRVSELSILRNPMLKSLAGLSALQGNIRTVSILENRGLHDLSGLDNLDFVSQNLVIAQNSRLESIEALANLESISVLEVYENYPIQDAEVLEVVERIGAEHISSLSVYDNGI